MPSIRDRLRPTARASIVALLAGTFVALFALPAYAQGQIFFNGCLGSDAAKGCFDLPNRPLDGAAGTAVSPDGKSVYVVSSFAQSITVLNRNSAGQIFFNGCAASDAGQGCVDLPGRPLDGATGVAVSPDNRSVYVANTTGLLTVFSRNVNTGLLGFVGCFGNTNNQGCIDLPFAPLSGARSTTVSADGKSVYVASDVSNSVAHFFRGTDGRLSYDGCLADDASQGCRDLPFAPLSGASGVAVSRDNKSVYVASRVSNSVSHFFRNSGGGGQIAFDGCLANDASQNCGDLPFAPLSGATGVAVSPDNGSVYVASQSSSSLAHFFRNSAGGGQIFYDGCLANDASQNCGDLPFAPLSGANSVTVSPDSASVYVTSSASASVGHFFRSVSGGQIFYDGCLAATGAQGCFAVGGSPFEGAAGVAVSQDGTSVYIASRVSHSLTHLQRAS